MMGWKLLLAVTLAWLAGLPAWAAPTTIFVEAETAAGTEQWSSQPVPGASGGAVLYVARRAGGMESPGVAVNIPHAGQYRVWIRHFKKTPAAANLLVLVRDEASEVVAFQRVDWVSRTSTETPYLTNTTSQAGKTGFVWDALELLADRPMAATVSVGGNSVTERQVDCVLVTSDRNLDPNAIDAGKLPALATAPVTPAAVPAGMVRSPGVPAKIEAFAGILDPDRQFWSGVLNVGALYLDGARMIRMGFNRDHHHGSSRWGIHSSVPVEGFNEPAFNKAHPSPAGRFVNAQGQVGQMFSLHYPPRAEAEKEFLQKRIRETLAKPDADYVGHWRTSSEEGGWLDYSSYAVDAFRAWLQTKHGAIETLNSRWGTNYTSFAEITPPKNYEENRAGWLEFRDFNGESYAASIARRIATVHAADPKRRPCLGANSNLDIAAPFFMAFRPMDWSEFIRVGLKEEKLVSFDIYCADDDMGNSIDLLTSFAQGRKLINQEFSNHVVDPRLAARTYWMQVGKGVRGIHLFNFQEGEHATYPKWALLSRDGSPKQKLAAYSDAAQEVHRLEPLLMAATYTHAVKPVALYWSRIDLGLDLPHDSWYGHGLNSPIHIYRTLRSLGYPVRWITPRQITEGELAQVGALVMAGCNHIPQAAAQKIEAWVKSGGAVIVDSWPGAFDEYGQRQVTLAPIFGVRPVPKKGTPEGSDLALQESRQGYGEVTDAAAQRDKYFQKIDEVAQQPGATHPVAVAMGDFMLAGFAMQRVECVAGKVVAMTHRSPGWPGMIVNDYGQGKSLYSAMLLGTIYEAAPVRYEWDTTQSGLSYGRLLDAFLQYAGVKTGSRITGLTPRVAAKLRVESPLVAPDGNVLIGLTSMNDDVVKPFDLEVEVPVRQFAKVFVTTGGSRQLILVEHQIVGTKLKLRMPAFDTHATILALKDAGPLVSLELKSIERGPANLGVIKPGQSFEVEAVVHNPSLRPLPAGKLAFTAPPGWLQSTTETQLKTIPTGSEARFKFRVQSPELAGPCRIVPLLARFENSAPTTEMVWWGLP